MSPQEDIRRLTALIHALDPQQGHPIEHRLKDNVLTFHHVISNILTTGRGFVDVLALSGGPLTPLNYDLSLAGHLHGNTPRRSH